jgi:hypothetical protein
MRGVGSLGIGTGGASTLSSLGRAGSARVQRLATVVLSVVLIGLTPVLPSLPILDPSPATVRAATPPSGTHGVSMPADLHARLPFADGAANQQSIGWSYGQCAGQNGYTVGDHCNGGGDGGTGSQDYYALDFSSASSWNVYPIASGTLFFVGWAKGGWSSYGRIVVVEHNVDGQAYYSLYTHLSSWAAFLTPYVDTKPSATVKVE